MAIIEIAPVHTPSEVLSQLPSPTEQMYRYVRPGIIAPRDHIVQTSYEDLLAEEIFNPDGDRRIHQLDHLSYKPNEVGLLIASGPINNSDFYTVAQISRAPVIVHPSDNPGLDEFIAAELARIRYTQANTYGLFQPTETVAPALFFSLDNIPTS